MLYVNLLQMPLAGGNYMMPGFTRIVSYDPLPNVGYGKAEVKDEPQDGPSTEVVVVTDVPQGGMRLNLGDRFTLLTPAIPPAVQVRFECLLLDSCFFEHLCKMKWGPTDVGVR